MMQRRTLLAGLGAAGAFTREAWAQPTALANRPIRLIVGFAAGGPVDAVARELAPRLSAALNGLSVVVDNQAGALGAVAINGVARAPADGHTLLFGASGNIVISPLVSRSAPDASRLLTPVGMVCTSAQMLVVSAQLPVRTLAEFIAYARANPRRVNFASGGTGGIAHLAAELFQAATGVEADHVPYRGTGPLMNDLVSNRVQATITSIPSVSQLVESGALRALGLTAPTEAASVRGVPVMALEGLPALDFTNWYGVFAPAGTPRPVIEQLNAAIRTAGADPDMRARLAAQGVDVKTGTPEQMAEYMRADAARWREVIQARNITLD